MRPQGSAQDMERRRLEAAPVARNLGCLALAALSAVFLQGQGRADEGGRTFADEQDVTISGHVSRPVRGPEGDREEAATGCEVRLEITPENVQPLSDESPTQVVSARATTDEQGNYSVTVRLDTSREHFVHGQLGRGSVWSTLPFRAAISGILPANTTRFTFDIGDFGRQLPPAEPD